MPKDEKGAMGAKATIASESGRHDSLGRQRLFEMLRYLVERLPISVTPGWVDTPCPPIAIRDAPGQLHDGLHAPETLLSP
jgi:hypothetical protein